MNTNPYTCPCCKGTLAPVECENSIAVFCLDCGAAMPPGYDLKTGEVWNGGTNE